MKINRTIDQIEGVFPRCAAFSGNNERAAELKRHIAWSHRTRSSAGESNPECCRCQESLSFSLNPEIR